MNSFPETYIDPYYQLLKIGSVVNTVEIKQTNKQTKTCMIRKVFKNRRERENGVLPRGGQSDREKKKQETVAKVFKNRRDIENGLLPRGGQSDRQK